MDRPISVWVGVITLRLFFHRQPPTPSRPAMIFPTSPFGAGRRYCPGVRFRLHSPPARMTPAGFRRFGESWKKHLKNHPTYNCKTISQVRAPKRVQIKNIFTFIFLVLLRPSRNHPTPHDNGLQWALALLNLAPVPLSHICAKCLSPVQSAPILPVF